MEAFDPGGKARTQGDAAACFDANQIFSESHIGETCRQWAGSLGDIMNDTDFASLADNNAKTLQSSDHQNELLHEIVATNDIVFGLFPDKTTKAGWDKHLIKGSGVLSLIAGGNKKFSKHHKVTAIWCKEIAEAQAMERAYGDDRD